MICLTKDREHSMSIERHRIVILVTAFLLLSPSVYQPLVCGQAKDTNHTNWKFDFGPGKVAPGYVQILANTVYSKELGYGFEPAVRVSCVDRGGAEALRSDFCTAANPSHCPVGVTHG